MIDNLNELLLKVQKPARYIGGEWNAIKKEWTDNRVKVLLAFPDVYDVGMSYLGTKILYGLVNSRDDCLCERVYSPWPDFENVLRENKISLFSLESRRPIKDFDIIGFSIAYELSYTNILNVLDLGGIPKKSVERSDGDPLIIAGGPSVYNPEPVAEFIDAFVIGEAEEAMLEVIEAYRGSGIKRQGSKKELLRTLSKIPGVYVPSLYQVEYNEDRTIKKITPQSPDVPSKITKRFVMDLENAYYPTKQIVPHIQIVHDRIALEILRGCRHACKFCMAGATYRPWRVRSKERILKLAEEAYKMTGYDEISLLSLSSSDHPHIREIIEGLNDIFKNKAVSISIPSLRIQDVLKDLPVLLSKVSKAGLTFAPESGSEGLRKFINKNIDIGKLSEAASASFRAGWNRVKLYFMIGLPTESEDDILSIAELVEKISGSKKALDGKPAHVGASINVFIPKPHTYFERRGLESFETLQARKNILKVRVRSRMIELDFNSFERSYIEAVFSRGDRRLSEVIYHAWKSGARFDSWKDHFRYDIWLDSFEKCGIDHHFYANRERREDEILPWSLISLI